MPKRRSLLTPDQLSDYFTSESLLQQAIVGLLSKLEGISRVQILQGPQELGKDIVFYRATPLEGDQLCACVVKNTRLTGQVGRASGARTVYQQIEQAFGIPHMNESGEQVVVQNVFVVTPHPISPAAISSIQDLLRTSARNVKFIGGPHLFDLFRRHWPEFLKAEFSAIRRYLQTSATKIVEDRPLSQAGLQYGVGTVERNVIRMYVHPDCHRTLEHYKLAACFDQELVKPIREELIAVREKKKGPLPSPDNAQVHWKALNSGLSALSEWHLVDPKKIQPLARKWHGFLSRLSKLTSQQNKERFARKALGLSLQDVARNAVKYSEQLLRLLEGFDVVLTKMRGDLQSRLSAAQFELPSKDATPTAILRSAAFIDASVVCDLAVNSKDVLVPLESENAYLFHSTNIDAWDASVLVVGPAGHGKTSFCRWHALDDAERFTLGQSEVVPLYIPLYQFAREKIASFDKTFLKHLGQSGLILNPAGGRDLKKAKKIRVYLDGLDEITDSEQRKRIVTAVRTAAVRSRRYQIILTARDHVFDPGLYWLPRIHLSPLSDNQIETLASQWLGRDQKTELLNQLKGTPVIRELMKRPLLTTLTILVFRQTRRLPENRVRLYEIFIDLLSGGWDIAKGIQRGSRLGSDLKVMILKRLAYRVHLQNKKEFSEKVVKDVLADALTPEYAKKWRTVRDELSQDGLVRTTADQLEFTHLSFQEFLVAKHLRDSPDGAEARLAFREYLKGSDWWKEVLVFYVSLTNDPLGLWGMIRVLQTYESRSRIEFLKSIIEKEYPQFRLPWPRGEEL
jgi:hypothetical protein